MIKIGFALLARAANLYGFAAGIREMTPTERRQLRNAARWMLREATEASRELGGDIELSVEYEHEPNTKPQRDMPAQADDDHPTTKLRVEDVQQ